MVYYITTPFHDGRAVVNFTEPTDEPYFEVDKLPDGDGWLMVENGKLVRVSHVVLPPIKNPFTDLEEQSLQLRQNELQSDLALDLLAEHEEWMCMQELLK